MSRPIIHRRNLDGQVVRLEPDSYVGECSAVGTRFEGSLFNNSWFQVDASKADFSGVDKDTKHFYSRFCAFTDAVLPSFIQSVLNYEMVAEWFRQRQASTEWTELPGATQNLLSRVESELKSDFTRSWSHYGREFKDSFASTQIAEEGAVKFFGEHPNFLERILFTIKYPNEKVAFPKPKDDWDILHSGIVNYVDELNPMKCGIQIKRAGKEAYLVPVSQLPKPDRPHDRCDMEGKLGPWLKSEHDMPGYLPHVAAILPFLVDFADEFMPDDWWHHCRWWGFD